MIPNDEYLKRAEGLTADERDRLLCRMRGKLARRVEDKKRTKIAALAIQLEVEDTELIEWREKMNEIKQKRKSQEKTLINEVSYVP